MATETIEPVAWRYAINYGPEGEENYANVYDAQGELVGNLRTHHARAVVAALTNVAQARAEGKAEGMRDGQALLQEVEPYIEALHSLMGVKSSARATVFALLKKVRASLPAPPADGEVKL